MYKKYVLKEFFFCFFTYSFLINFSQIIWYSKIYHPFLIFLLKLFKHVDNSFFFLRTMLAFYAEIRSKWRAISSRVPTFLETISTIDWENPLVYLLPPNTHPKVVSSNSFPHPKPLFFTRLICRKLLDSFFAKFCRHSHKPTTNVDAKIEC